MWRMSTLLGNYVASVPAQMRVGPRWFIGSADAIYQNLNLIYDERPTHICVLGADHIYRMDMRQMIDHHVRSGAALTLAGIRVPIDQAPAFGIIESDAAARVLAFREKPPAPQPLPDAPDQAYASMGVYVFDAGALVDAVTADSQRDDSVHDVGGSIVPALVERGEATVYDFSTNVVPGATDRDRGYWRDVGDLDIYYEANMDLVAPDPIFNLYNSDWPIYTLVRPLPPAKFVFDEEGRRGVAVDSLISAGVIVSGASVRRSVLSPGAFVHTGALVEGSVLMDDVDVARGAVVRNTIIDKNVRVPAGARIGVDAEHDRARFHVSRRGVVALPKGLVIDG
jgi:glucose-1-phosphate adenylyltransferase